MSQKKSEQEPQFNNEQQALNYYRPVLSKVNEEYIDILDDENNDFNNQLISRCSKSTKTRDILDELNHLLDNFESIDNTTYVLPNHLKLSRRETHQQMLNSRRVFDAMTYLMYDIKEKYTKNAVFLDMTYTLKLKDTQDSDSNDNKKIIVVPDKVEIRINSRNLAIYLYHRFYKNHILISQSDSETKKPYYVYQRNKNHWLTSFGQTLVRQKIEKLADNMHHYLSYSSEDSHNRVVFNTLFKSIKSVEDKDVDYIEKFTQAFPQWVQFKDLVYDLREHKVAKAQPFFKLKQYHDYRIPTGLTEDEIDNLPIDDELNGIDFENGLHKDILKSDNELSKKIKNLFVDCTITKEEVRKNADIFIRRMNENFSEDKHEFILSILGNLFFHSNDWAVIPFIRGGAGIGKSKLFNFVAEELIQDGNFTNIDQGKLERKSNFIESAFYGKEYNLIGELKGKVLSAEVANYFKATISDNVSIERKGLSHKSTKIYAKPIALGNVGQMPSIPTDDANDGGLKRRIVIIDCEKMPKTDDFDNEYPENELRKVKSDFALLCMMTFNAHKKDIGKFQHPKYSGCTNQSISGFTSQNMVKATQSYFTSHDRYRKFMCTLPDKYRQQCEEVHKPSAEYMEEPARFREWLNIQSSATIKKWFIEWYNEEYPRTNVNKEKFAIYLNETHNIYEKARKFKLEHEYNPNQNVKKQKRKDKSVRGYGKQFTELVESIVLEDAPYLAIGHNSDLDYEDE